MYLAGRSPLRHLFADHSGYFANPVAGPGLVGVTGGRSVLRENTDTGSLRLAFSQRRGRPDVYFSSELVPVLYNFATGQFWLFGDF